MSGFLGNDIMNLLSGFWHQADTISIAIVILQCTLFIFGFFIFFYKIIKLSSYSRAEPMVIAGFWGAHNLTAAIDFLVTTKGARWHNQLVHRAVSAASWKKIRKIKGYTLCCLCQTGCPSSFDLVYPKQKMPWYF